MVAANLKQFEEKIPVVTTRAEMSVELRRLLDKKIGAVQKKLIKYDNDGNKEMASAMDWYAEGMEYAYALILDLDEAYAKAYSHRMEVEV